MGLHGGRTCATAESLRRRDEHTPGRAHVLCGPGPSPSLYAATVTKASAARGCGLSARPPAAPQRVRGVRPRAGAGRDRAHSARPALHRVHAPSTIDSVPPTRASHTGDTQRATNPPASTAIAEAATSASAEAANSVQGARWAAASVRVAIWSRRPIPPAARRGTTRRTTGRPCASSLGGPGRRGPATAV
jgi:hypothetical protein